MRNPMKYTIALLLLSTAACVVTPPTHMPTHRVDVTESIEPRVQFGSRTQVSVWLHPQFAAPDAYIVAQRHCRRWGLNADPFNNWAYSTSDPRVLNYYCVRRRPVIVYPHVNTHPNWRNRRPVVVDRPAIVDRQPVIVDRPVIVNPSPPRRRTIAPPTNSWSRPKPVIKTPEVIEPRRPSIGTTTEVGKPWEYNNNSMTSPSSPNTEIGKPWEHNNNKNGFSRSERRNSLGGGFDNRNYSDPAPQPDPKPRRRSTLGI